jgi:hypothetical protein
MRRRKHRGNQVIVYTVHEPGLPAKSPGERADEVVFVKEGFTWWGFLFGPFWLLFNGLWFEFGFALLLIAGLSALLTQLGLKDQAAGIANLAVMLLVGFEGNDLRRWRLERKGYTLLAPVAAEGYEECERRFFEAWLPSIAKPAKPEPKPALNAPPSSWGDWPGPGVAGTFPGEVV